MNETTENPKQFAIQKLYVKDLSFESPSAPASFAFRNWDPKIDLNMTNRQSQVEGDLYEAVLTITVTVSHEDRTAFLVEVHQAGIFLIAGFNEDEKKYLLGSQCMNILFPYAREVISEMSVRGGFPPLVMSPVNFDSLYQQHLQQSQQKQAEQKQAEQAETETAR